MGGIPPLSGCQCWPPSRVVKTPELGADKQQVRRLVVDGDRIGGPSLGQVAGDVDPAFAPVGAPEHIGLEVAILVVVETRIDSIWIVT